MKFALAQSTVSLIFLSSVVSALPQSPSTLFRRQGTSPDGTCGGSNNYHCPSSAPCCSQWGWCGTSVDHCGAGCQPQFGNCNGGGTDPPTGNPREKFGSVPYGVIITECARPNTVAITFDDGPHIYTETLLNHFAAAGAKATFFLNGQNWGPVITDGAKQALVRRMIAEGHQVASHTWSHPDLSTLSYDGVRTQMMQLETALISIMGKYPTYMRPPYLSCGGTCQQALGDLGYHIMSTNLDTLDWQYNTPDTYWQSQNIFKQAVTPVGNNGRWLVLSHDVHQMTAENIGRYMIKKSREIGLQIVTVGECMNDPPENWYRTVQ